MVSLNQLFKDTTFLLGAGASKDVGCYLSSEMLARMKDDLYKEMDNVEFSQYQKDFKDIHDFIFACLSYQNEIKNSSNHHTSINIEEFVYLLKQIIDKEFIIPAPIVGNWSDKITKWELKNPDIFKLFHSYILNSLVHKWLMVDEGNAKEYLYEIRKLLEVPEDFFIKIFSLNYDLLFEKLNKTDESILANGFTPQSGDKEPVSFWSEQFNEASFTSKIGIYKLHGSLDWKYDQEEEKILQSENFYGNQNPLIIFGSGNKMNSLDPFLFLLSEFRKYLSTSKMIVVVGYSFFDKYINNMLIQMLMRDTSKKLIIIDPCIAGAELERSKLFCETLGKIQRTKSIDEIFNFSMLNPEKVHILKITAKDFFKEYFENKAEKLIELYENKTSEENFFN